jgi:magnesium-transporting ATPase (P-type)
MDQLRASPAGLTSAEAKRRLEFYGPNRLQTAKRTDALTLLLAQFKSPLILILLGAVVLSFFLGEPVDAIIIIAIVPLSSVLTAPLPACPNFKLLLLEQQICREFVQESQGYGLKTGRYVRELSQSVRAHSP